MTGPNVVAIRRAILTQRGRTVSLSGIVPITITPARDGSLTVSDGTITAGFPTSEPIALGYKGAWPQDPPPPPPPTGLVAPVDPTHFPVIPKPAKGAPWTVPTYGTIAARVTDHATDIPGTTEFRSDYSRRQPFNVDDTLMFGDQGNGFWGLYSVNGDSWTYLKRLNGPAGDAEMQWDPTDPHAIWFTPRNGGTILSKLDVISNTVVHVIDFGPQVRLLWPNASHCWTKSEGSPSRDGRYWGLMAEDGNYAPLGFFVLDTVTESIVWSMPNSVRPDHVSMSPCGRWFVRSGDDPQGTVAYGFAPDVLGQVRQLHHKSEHSDMGLLPNGHSFYVSVDYQTNDGDIFWTDLEDAAATRHVIGKAYHDPVNPNVYGMHFSAKAFAKPGFVVEGRYGDNSHPCNVMVHDLNTGAHYGVSLNYPVVSNYFDEPHACPNRTLTRIVANQNFGTSQNVDVVQARVTW